MMAPDRYGVLRRIAPRPLIAWYRARRQRVPAPGSVRLGNFDRHKPLSRWGHDRGTPIDRHYIAEFLEQHAGDIRGAVLEVGDPAYTRRFGNGRVESSDVLHVEPDFPGATVTADLTVAGALSAASYDCIICTQTLHQLYQVNRAVANLHQALKPGGVLLATVPGISQIDRAAVDRWGDYWRFTTLALERVFAEHFDPACTTIRAFGNVLTSAAFLYGMAVEELRAADVAYHHPDYQLLLTVRAVR